MSSYDGYRAQVDLPLLLPAERWGGVQLPGTFHDCRVIDVRHDVPRDVTVVTYEGARLPGWMRGTLPVSFRSLAELKQYRALRRIYDIRWPNDVAKSMGVVNLILLNRGPTKVIRSTKLRNTWEPPVPAHVVTMDEYRDLYWLATIEIGRDFDS
jgi:hypothetical protein